MNSWKCCKSLIQLVSFGCNQIQCQVFILVLYFPQHSTAQNSSLVCNLKKFKNVNFTFEPRKEVALDQKSRATGLPLHAIVQSRITANYALPSKGFHRLPCKINEPRLSFLFPFSESSGRATKLPLFFIVQNKLHRGYALFLAGYSRTII